MTGISITYCKPCGYEKRAIEAAELLQRELGIAATLVPGRGGIFEVKAGDQVVAKRRLGRFPSPAEIVAAVRAAPPMPEA